MPVRSRAPGHIPRRAWAVGDVDAPRQAGSDRRVARVIAQAVHHRLGLRPMGRGERRVRTRTLGYLLCGGTILAFGLVSELSSAGDVRPALLVVACTILLVGAAWGPAFRER